MAVGARVARWVTLAAAVAQMRASRYPMCCANQRLDAPASSASRQTSSISAVDENPSKNTPTDINKSLVETRAATTRASSYHGARSFAKGLLAAAADIRQRHRQ